MSSSRSRPGCPRTAEPLLGFHTMSAVSGGSAVGLSTRELARIRRGVVILGAGGLLVALGLLGGVAVGSAGKVRGYMAPTGTAAPWAVCWASVSTDLAVLERHLSPPGGASVQAGTPVVFSGLSGQPVTFAVASSPALLSSPDIDGGVGAAQPESAYAFTSTKASATPGSSTGTRRSPMLASRNALVHHRRPTLPRRKR